MINSRSLFIFLLLIFTSNYIYVQGQKKDKNAIPQIPYDSLSNFLGNDVAAYTGQTLKLKALSSGSQVYGYPGFILKYQKDKELINDSKNIYKCCDGYNSRYDDLVGREFLVIDVIKHPDSKKNEVSHGDDYYLHLEELLNSEKLYFKYNVDSEYTFPFIVLGYYEKQKQQYIGKRYVFANEITAELRDLKDGKAITATTPSLKWKCIDVVLDSKSNNILLIIEDTKGRKSSVPFSEIIDNAEVRKIYTASEADSYIKKFNINNFNRILQRKLRVGMTTDMCLMAWGKPLSIEETVIGKAKVQIWTYPAGIVSFRYDKIVSIK